MEYAVLKRHPFKPSELWVVWEPLLVFIQHYPALGRFTVPKGFQTDLASIPAPWRWIWPPHGHYTEAAVVHDWLYTENQVTKYLADFAFLMLMREYGVKEWKCKMFYWAVRKFGNPARSRREFKRRGGLLTIYPGFDVDRGVL